MADVDLDHPAEVGSVRLPKSFLPLSTVSSLRGSHFASMALQEWEVMLHFLKGRVSTSNTWNSYTQQICLSPSCSFIQSFFISVWTHEYLLYTLGSRRFYCLAQIISALNSGFSSVALVPVTSPSRWALILVVCFVFSNTPLSSATTRCYRYVNYISIKLKGGKHDVFFLSMST